MYPKLKTEDWKQVILSEFPFLLKDLMLIPQVRVLNNTDYAITQSALQTSQFKKLVKGFHNMELWAQRTHNTLSRNTTTYSTKLCAPSWMRKCQRNEKYRGHSESPVPGSLPRLCPRTGHARKRERSRKKRPRTPDSCVIAERTEKGSVLASRQKMTCPPVEQWALFKDRKFLGLCSFLGSLGTLII